MDLSTREGRREQGLLIQKVVERAGLSVEELANRIGCSRALIYQYLSGTTLAQPDRLQQIASLTGVPLAYFYGADEDPPAPPTQPEDARARVGERMEQLEELARAQESPLDWAGLARTAERMIGLATQAYDVAAEARALVRIGKARIHLGEFGRAVDSLNRAVALFGSLKDERGEADARQALGNALLATGRTSEAHDQFQWVANSGSWSARWSGLVSLAAVDDLSGNYRAAVEHCDEAAAVIEQGEDPRARAVGLLYVAANRVNLYLAGGDFRNAAELAERCATDAEALGNSDQHLEARLNLGVCGTYQGRWAQGHRALTAALSLSRFVGDRSREALSRAALALLLAAMGDVEAAIEQAREALSSALAQGDHRTELFAHLGLADSYLAVERHSEARYHANQAFAVAATLRITLYQGEARLRLGRVALRSGDAAEARAHAEGALADALKLGARHVEAQALDLRGRVRLARGDAASARTDADAARALAETIGMVPLLWEADALSAQAALSGKRPDAASAETMAARAVEGLERSRQDLVEAGLPDTVLENREWQDIYLLRARTLAAAGRRSEVETFVQQAAWPPLAARLAAQPV